MPPTNLLTPSKPCSQEGVVQQPHHSLGRHIEVHLLQVELTAVQGCHRPLCLSPHLNIPATHKNIHFFSFFIHTHSLTSFSHTHSLTSCTYTHLSTLPPSTHAYLSSPILSPPSSHMRTSPHFPFLCRIHLSTPPYSVCTSTLTSPPSSHIHFSPPLPPHTHFSSPSHTLTSPSFPSPHSPLHPPSQSRLPLSPSLPPPHSPFLPSLHCEHKHTPKVPNFTWFKRAQQGDTPTRREFP